MKLHIVAYHLWSVPLLLCCVYGVPVSQPSYHTGTQYINAIPASIPAQLPQPQQQPTYFQQLSQQPAQYVTAGLLQQSPAPIYNDAQRAPPQFLPQLPTQKVPQLILPSNVDRQVQKVAHHTGGPFYAQQISAVQKQTAANNALAAAQRRAQEQVRLIQQQQEFERQRQIDSLRPQEPHIVYYPGNSKQQQQQQPLQQLQYQQQQQPTHSQPIIRTIPGASYGNNNVIGRKNDEAPEEEHDNNASYQFGFDVNDDQYTNYQNRKEQREGGKITGSYSVVDSDGFIRTVTYTADPKEGFKAEVVRKPTDIVVKIPTPTPSAREQQQEHQQYIQEVPVNKITQGQKQNIVYRYE